MTQVFNEMLINGELEDQLYLIIDMHLAFIG